MLRAFNDFIAIFIDNYDNIILTSDDRPLAWWRQKAQSGGQNKRFFLSWELESTV